MAGESGGGLGGGSECSDGSSEGVEWPRRAASEGFAEQSRRRFRDAVVGKLVESGHLYGPPQSSAAAGEEDQGGKEGSEVEEKEELMRTQQRQELLGEDLTTGTDDSEGSSAKELTDEDLSEEPKNPESGLSRAQRKHLKRKKLKQTVYALLQRASGSTLFGQEGDSSPRRQYNAECEVLDVSKIDGLENDQLLSQKTPFPAAAIGTFLVDEHTAGKQPVIRQSGQTGHTVAKPDCSISAFGPSFTNVSHTVAGNLKAVHGATFPTFEEAASLGLFPSAQKGGKGSHYTSLEVAYESGMRGPAKIGDDQFQDEQTMGGIPVLLQKGNVLSGFPSFSGTRTRNRNQRRRDGKRKLEGGGCPSSEKSWFSPVLP